MQIVDVLKSGKNYKYKWPLGFETFSSWIEYKTISQYGEHKARIGYGTRSAYEKDRVRIVVWIDGRPCAEFFSADDYEVSGEVLSEIHLQSGDGKTMCRYPDDTIPERYTAFNTVGLPNRVKAKGVHNAWMVVANIADHRTMIGLAALRRAEKI